LCVKYNTFFGYKNIGIREGVFAFQLLRGKADMTEDRSAPKLFIPSTVIEEWIREDIPFTDTTTLDLGISGIRGEALVVTREDIVVSATEEASMIYQRLGCVVRDFKPSGTMAVKDDVLLHAEGNASCLHMAWRIAQATIAYSSGVATLTRKMVEEARRVNKNITLATTRKTPPGSKYLYIKGVLSGGGIPHRYGLSDSILVFDNHIRFVGGERPIKKAVDTLKKRHPERKIGIEVKSLEEALEAAGAGAEYIQLEKIPPVKAREIVSKLKSNWCNIFVGVSGGITLDNIREYASTGADVIVTSAPYHSRPADITTILRPL
jgi:molybdenum transport protein